MAKGKCDLCQQRKGKRPCPARAGEPICPRCCAQKRVVELDCPADCPFLGAEGALLLADRGGAPEASEEQVNDFINTLRRAGFRPSLLDDVEPSARETLADMAAFDQSQDPDDEGALGEVILDWFMLGACDAKGRRVVDDLVARLGRSLNADERGALQSLHGCRFGLYTLGEQLGGEPTPARDLLSEESVTLLVGELGERFAADSVVGTFTVPVTGGLAVMGGVWDCGKIGTENLLEQLRTKHLASAVADQSLQTFLTRHALLIPLLLFAPEDETDDFGPLGPMGDVGL